MARYDIRDLLGHWVKLPPRRNEEGVLMSPVSAFLVDVAAAVVSALMVTALVAMVRLLRSVGATAAAVGQLTATVGEVAREHAETRERLARLEGAARWPLPSGQYQSQPPWNGRLHAMA